MSQRRWQLTTAVHQRGKGEQYNASGRINFARKSIDSDDMTRSFIPRAVFPPVRGGDFLPSVVECAIERVNTHDSFVMNK